MSWLEWHQQVLPTGPNNDADLRVFLDAPDACGERQDWTIDFHHLILPSADSPAADSKRFITARLETLGNVVTDWRDCGRLEITATSAWHSRVDNTPGYHRSTCLEVANATYDSGDDNGYDQWYADYFRLTLSPPTGNYFPCELDAWLEPKETFWRKTPLTGSEITRIPTGPPNLRIITRARFCGGEIKIENGPSDPLATARQRIKRAIGLEECEMTLSWYAESQRYLKGLKGPVPKDEQRRCSINFRIPPP